MTFCDQGLKQLQNYTCVILGHTATVLNVSQRVYHLVPHNSPASLLPG